MLDEQHYRGLPPIMERPAWCRSEDPGDWWLPWQPALILSAAKVAPWEMTGSGLSRATGVGVGSLYVWIDRLEHLGLLESAWEDEVHPEQWTARIASGTLTTDGPRRRYYAATERGRFWLTALPNRAKPDLFGRPGFWVGSAILLLAAWLIVIWLG